METHRVHGLSVVLEAGGRAILARAAVDKGALRTKISIERSQKTPREESKRAPTGSHALSRGLPAQRMPQVLSSAVHQAAGGSEFHG